MSELQELYQELILDHSKSPRNFGPLPGANSNATGYNPLCGDKIDVYAIVEAGLVTDIRFEGVGCAISMASASLMTEMVKGKTKTEVEKLFKAFHAVITGNTVPDVDGGLLDKLTVLSGIAGFPSRVKCATLPWHTIEAALKNTKGQVSTE